MKATVLLLLKRDLISALRSRWLYGFSISFAGLGSAFSYLGALGLGEVGFRAYSAAIAGIINLNLYAVPLAAVIASSLSLVSEREKGTMEFLLSLPTSRWEIVFSRLVSNVVSISAAIVLGYGLASWLLWLLVSETDLLIYLSILWASIVLAYSFAGIGLLISSLVRSRFAALALSLGVWIGLVMVYEVVLMAAVILLNLSPLDVTPLLLANPVQASRLVIVKTFDPSMSLLGEFGAFIQREFGETLASVLIGSQIAIGTACTLIAMLTFSKGDL
ncbi:Inner membrane transport permease YbhR [Candidatus Calditenuaceae archaeon HR02]|nr:Inner membrane transport permease YbhR [Candidatus Calditenuaceae archaeon HR02]